MGNRGLVAAATCAAMGTFLFAGLPGAHANRGKQLGHFKGLRFEADLSGEQEVPPVETETAGEIKLLFDEDLTALRFELEVEDGRAITQAHLHCGERGENGPVVVFLFGLIPGGFDVDGDIAEHTITDANIMAVNADCTNAIGMDINTVADLAAAMEAGLVYANVHSIAHPGGEVRGQLGDDGEDDGDDDDANDNSDGGDHGH